MQSFREFEREMYESRGYKLNPFTTPPGTCYRCGTHFHTWSPRNMCSPCLEIECPPGPIAKTARFVFGNHNIDEGFTLKGALRFYAGLIPLLIVAVYVLGMVMTAGRR